MLKEQRDAAGLSLVRLSAKVGHPVATLHRMETGERTVTSEVEVVHYLAACGASHVELKRLAEFCRESGHQRGHWVVPSSQWISDSLRSLVFHESTANRSVSYESEIIPGLLQTEPYMRTFFAHWDLSADEMDALVRARIERQRVLFRNNPAKYTFFVHERALHLEIGDFRIMAEQMLAMMFFADQWNIEVRIVPSAARQRGLFGGSFKYHGYKRFKPLVYMDAPMGGVFFEDERYVERVRALVPKIADVALEARESRDFVAKLADKYDRSEGGWDDAWRVAQHQL